jgi:hypothetical protein
VAIFLSISKACVLVFCRQFPRRNQREGEVSDTCHKGQEADLPKGQRPFRVHIDPANDGAEIVNNVGDLVREHFYHRIGLGDLLTSETTG